MKGHIRESTISIDTITLIGLVNNKRGFPPFIMRARLSWVSAIGPRIIPKTSGARGIFAVFRIYPNKPNKSATTTSK